MLEKYADAFDIFARTEAVVVEKGDYDDYENSYTLKEIDRVTGDLQPYSGDLLKADYGLARECQKRFFCRKNDNITEGALLKIGGRYFEVTYVADWEAGHEVMLNEVTINDGRE